MSRPYALPLGPPRRADNRTSIPPPEPRSSTVSPSRSSATAVGLPHPRLARVAVPGSSARSAAAYSAGPNRSCSHPAPQHEPTGPQSHACRWAAAAVAASPHLILTSSRRTSALALITLIVGP